MLDARAWLLWALTVLVTASSTRNPLYVVLLLLITMVAGVACAPTLDRRGALLPLRFAAVAIPMAALFNGLTAHLGDTVLFRLPDGLPLLGGPVTLEALVFGAMNGLTLTAIFGGFTVFNRVTPARDLVRLTPRAFHEAGVVLSIALTFIPQTTRSLARITGPHFTIRPTQAWPCPPSIHSSGWGCWDCSRRRWSAPEARRIGKTGPIRARTGRGSADDRP